MLLLVSDVHEKTAQVVRQNFERVCALFEIDIRVTTLHLCNMRMHSFSANQKHVIFCVHY